MSMAYDSTIPLKYSTFPAYLVSYDIVGTNFGGAVMDSPAFWISTIDESMAGAIFSHNPAFQNSTSDTPGDFGPFFSAIRGAVSTAVSALSGTAHWGTTGGEGSPFVEVEVQNFHVERYDAPAATDVTPA
jgi:hypothetical protein